MTNLNAQQSIAPGRKLEDYVTDILEYWDDDELRDHFGRAMSMYDIFVEASERLSGSEIDDICRDIEFTPAGFDRFVRIGKIHQERKKKRS
jgi:hypothetical protein